MKTIKTSLANVQGKLSRTEMKNIMAGVATSMGTCQARVALNNGGYTVFTGLTSSEAQTAPGMVN